ncbi:hypothetical protein BDU57DRAFT_109835 [Ampelomyces quisqualis]|uniref:DUF6594 domain-containing protein n=1 Tax=Ampelomyces quisqualis TaxID=50730 RepID=A0A6A5Q8I0_AMPQU|nr:hypothetical protein BDU57DRAFT_109835 [Ampelomyces quisqualis]
MYPPDIEFSAGSQQGGPPEPRPLRGFPSLAAFMSHNSNSESFIFKRFDRLAARNLLYLQAELAYLQDRLDELDRVDAQPPYDLEARKCARSWEDFEANKDSSSKQHERWNLMHRTRATLREYQETLIRQSESAALGTPSKGVLEAFTAEFYGKGPSLLGSSETIYNSNDSNTQDLVQIYCTERKDRVSAFLAKHMFRWLQTTASSKSTRVDPRVTYLYTQRLDLAVEFFYALLSIALLLGAILSLYFVENPFWRIGIIILFTLLFATCAVFLADGRRLAVFGACAAYAAVLVVFVSGNWSPETSELGTT